MYRCLLYTFIIYINSHVSNSVPWHLIHYLAMFILFSCKEKVNYLYCLAWQCTKNWFQRIIYNWFCLSYQHTPVRCKFMVLLFVVLFQMMLYYLFVVMFLVPFVFIVVCYIILITAMYRRGLIQNTSKKVVMWTHVKYIFKYILREKSLASSEIVHWFIQTIPIWLKPST